MCKSVPLTPDMGCKYDDKEANVTFDMSVLKPTGHDIQVCAVVSVWVGEKIYF